VTIRTSSKVANFWRGIASPGKVDDAVDLLNELGEGFRRDDPGTEAYSIYIEPPDAIWLYALFTDQEALDEHRRRGRADPRVRVFQEMLSDRGTPTFVSEIDPGSGGM
jgi:quinol monooxygenase YgiN